MDDLDLRFGDDDDAEDLDGAEMCLHGVGWDEECELCGERDDESEEEDWG